MMSINSQQKLKPSARKILLPKFRVIKIFENTFTAKTKVERFLKDKKFQFYVVPDLEAPLKAVLRRLPKSVSPDKIMDVLNSKNFDVTKITQIRSRKDERIRKNKIPKRSSILDHFSKFALKQRHTGRRERPHSVLNVKKTL